MRIATKLTASILASFTLMACQAEAPKTAGVSGKTVVSTGTASIGGPFTLVDDTGLTVTEADLLGKPHLIYFGFAYCPDICPTSLQKLGAAQTLLGDAGDDVGYILITVDPERDTVEKLAQYVTFEPFPSGLRGFTGSSDQIETAKVAYKITATKSALDGGPVEEGSTDYTVNHSDIIYFMGADGKFADFFSSRSTPQDIAIRVRQELMKSEK
ncbi:MAG: SCO family protein [Litorimonas sp.]